LKSGTGKARVQVPDSGLDVSDLNLKRKGRDVFS
jgi:hypothetical protein